MSADIHSNRESQELKSTIDLKKYPIPKILVSKEDTLANDERIAAINSKRIES